jgi:hypothetical protein
MSLDNTAAISESSIRYVVRDYRTDEVLPGAPTALLVAESLSCPIGAESAVLSGGVWQHVAPEMSGQTPDARLVWIEVV